MPQNLIDQRKTFSSVGKGRTVPLLYWTPLSLFTSISSSILARSCVNHHFQAEQRNQVELAVIRRRGKKWWTNKAVTGNLPLKESMHRASSGLRWADSTRAPRRCDHIIVTLHHGPALCFYALFRLHHHPSPLTFSCHAPAALLCPPPPPNISDDNTWFPQWPFDLSWLPFIAAIQPNRLWLDSAISFYVLIAADLSFFFFSFSFLFSPPRHFPPRRVTQSNILVNHHFPSRLFLTIMAGFAVVGCLVAALSPFKVCFSQFNGSPIHHTLAVPVCLQGGGDLLSPWKLLCWCCHLVKKETLPSVKNEWK